MPSSPDLLRAWCSTAVTSHNTHHPTTAHPLLYGQLVQLNNTSVFSSCRSAISSSQYHLFHFKCPLYRVQVSLYNLEAPSFKYLYRSKWSQFELRVSLISARYELTAPPRLHSTTIETSQIAIYREYLQHFELQCSQICLKIEMPLLVCPSY